MRSFAQRKKMCFDKRPFPTKASALETARPQRFGRQYAYRCPECKGWHLTHSKQREA